MSEGFTPGPWHIGTTFSCLEGWKIVAKQGPIDVCTGFASGLADAHLIAAAPDLFNALKAAHHALRSYQYGNSSTELAMSVANHAEATLAKARGEAA